MKSYVDASTWHAIFIVSYALLSFVFITFAPSAAYQSVFWPCSGVALVFTLFLGYRAIASLILSALAVYCILSFTRHEEINFLTLGVVVLLPALQAALACFLVNYFNGRNYWLFNHWRRFLGFIFFGGFIPAVLLSLCLTSYLCYEKSLGFSEVFYIGLSVFFGNALGVVITAPCLLLLMVSNNRISYRNRLNSIIPVLVLFVITLLGYVHLHHLFKSGIGYKNQMSLDKDVAYLREDLARMSEAYQSVRYYLMANATFLERDFYSVAGQVYERYSGNENAAFFGFGLVKLPQELTQQSLFLTTVYPFEPYQFLRNTVLSEQAFPTAAKTSETLHFLTNIDAVRNANGDFLLLGLQPLGALHKNLWVAIIFDATMFFNSVFGDKANYVKAIKVDDLLNDRLLYRNDPAALFASSYNANHEQILTLGNLTLRITVAYDVFWLEREVQRHLLLMGIIALCLIGIFTVMILGALVGLHSLVTVVNKQSLELENEKRFLDSIFDHLPVLISVKDASTRRYLRVNKVMESFYGLSRDYFKGKTADKIFPAEQAIADSKLDNAVLESGKIIDFEGQWQSYAGSTRYINTKKLPVFNALGDIVYILGISEDLTDKVESQKHLSKRNELISLGLDAAGLGSWEWLLEDKQFVLSPTLCAILGFELNGATVSGEVIRSLIIAEDFAQFLASNEIAKKSLDVTDFCFRIRKPDNCIIWVSGKYRYFINDHNKIVRA